MKTKYLYFNGAYLYSNAELRETVQEVIDRGETKDGLIRLTKDALIRLLGDLYRNGHLRTFCLQEEYDKGVEKKDYKVVFDNNLIGDIRIANHVAGRLKGDDSYAPFYGDFHKYFHFSSVSIFRTEEPSIKSKFSRTKHQDERDHIYLLNGYRKHIHPKQEASIVITYSIDIKETLNEQIPIFVNREKADITIDLSKAKEKQEIKVPISESFLDPANDIEIWFGHEGNYGRIILKAPQIKVPLQFKGKTIIYPMMRVFQQEDYFYIGVWPFEYTNTSDWENTVLKNEYLKENYSHRFIDFFLETDIMSSFPENYQKELFSQIVWKNETLLEPTQKGYWRIGIPSKEEWEEAALMNKGATMIGSIISKYTIDQNCELSSTDLKRQMKVRPNALGIYAMLGNIHELALNDTTPYYMGGDIRVREEIKEIDLAPIDRDHINRVSLFCYRFIIHYTDFNDPEAILDVVYKEQHKNDIDYDPFREGIERL